MRQTVVQAGYARGVPMIRFLDLFAGCGGMTRGFLDAKGYTSVGGVEYNLDAASTYAANFGINNTVYGDIADYTAVRRADIVIGGPPCQGFSNLGKRDPDDPRNSLFREFVRVVAASKADLFVFENVNRFAASAEHALLLAETRPDGPLSGFSLQTMTLNAADFGTPQKRIRTVIFGSRIGPVDAPVATHSKRGRDSLPSWVTVRDAIAGFTSAVSTTQLADQTDRWWGHTVAGPYKLKDIHIGRTYKEESLKRYSYIAPGRGRFDLPEELQYPCWRKHKTGASDVLGRLRWDEPSVTIRTEFFKPEKGRYLHPEWSAGGMQVNRALTHAEAAALQGFDDRHVWCGSKVEIARQIGNAVPPPLAVALAQVVKKRFRNPIR